MSSDQGAPRLLPVRAGRRGYPPLVAALLFLLSIGIASPAGAADPVQDAITRALSWLHTQQRTDGSFGGASVTADAVYALALLGENPAGPAWTVSGKSALDGLEATAPAYATRGAGEAGKILRAVALTCADPRRFAGLDLVSLVEAEYDPATGRYHPDYLYRHTLAVEGLLRAGQPVPAKAFDTLFASQFPDGSWNWSFGAAVGEVDTTGRVMLVLAGLAELGNPNAYERAVDYLDAGQLASAGWGVNPAPDSNPANANSTALAVAGLGAVGQNPDDPRFQIGGKGGLQALLEFQEASGAFRYMQPPGNAEVRLIATLEALMALARPQPDLAPCRRTYLPLILRSR